MGVCEGFAFLLCLCILIVMYALFRIFCFHRANWHSSATLTEVFPCFFPSCKANARYNSQRRGTARTVPKLVVPFCVLSVCNCVLYYCHRVSTHLQLTNISVYTQYSQYNAIILQIRKQYDVIYVAIYYLFLFSTLQFLNHNSLWQRNPTYQHGTGFWYMDIFTPV